MLRYREGMCSRASILPPSKLLLAILDAKAEYQKYSLWLRLPLLCSYLCLPPSCSSDKRHIALTDSSNHSAVFAWQVQTVTDTQLIGWKGCLQGREWGKKLNRKQNPPCMTSLPHPPTPFFYLQHPRPPLLFLSSILFPPSFHSCHCIFFNPAKSVLIANHHGPAKWQIILHSFITKPSSSYFVSQHVVYVQLPCLLIQSASQCTPWQITEKDGGCSPSQMLINPNNISYVFFYIERRRNTYMCLSDVRSSSLLHLFLLHCLYPFKYTVRWKSLNNC